MLIQGSPERRLFKIFTPGVAYAAVENQAGEKGIGSCIEV
jgi:hypothetical protein